ncbi:MAG: hypothetical protein ACM3OB_04880 [Acidobacteriota bacterium]
MVTASRPAPIEPPEWIWELVDRRREVREELPSGLELRCCGGEDAQLVSVRVNDARALGAEAFAARTAAAYDAIGRVLGTELHPLRLWNFVPGILDPLGGLAHRYMVFNRGRYRACAAWCGGDQNFEHRLATASAVGHRGDDLWVHALAGRQPGRPVENPRQVAAYRYSARYGPLPPCFARATLLAPGRGGERRLLIGGTASVRGEDSVFASSLDDQMVETLENLGAVVRAGARVAARESAANGTPAGNVGLERLRDVRIYFVRDADREALAAAGRAAFPEARTCELVAAQLCRPELLVEIEALAELF